MPEKQRSRVQPTRWQRSAPALPKEEATATHIFPSSLKLPHALFHAQRTLGNQAVQRMLFHSSPPIASPLASRTFIQRMMLVIGSDAATKGAAGDMQKSGSYGGLITKVGDAKIAIEGKDRTLHIVAHCESATNLGGKQPAAVASMLVEDLRLFDNKGTQVNKIYIHACYSAGFAQNLSNALLQHPSEKVHFISVLGTIGLSVTDLKGASRVLRPGAFGATPEADYEGYQSHIKNGKISEERFKSVIEPKLLAPGEGWS
jgi:hypothetical protein